MQFNQFVKHAAHRGVGINAEREKFHQALCSDGGTERTIEDFWQAWERFCREEDAADEQQTLDDVRYGGCW